ncbi:hypothetical protein EV1_015619 [Malus domestica]
MRAIPMSEKPGLKQVLEDSVAEAEGDQSIRDYIAEPVNQELRSAWSVGESVADGDKQVEEDKGKVTEDSGKEEFVDCSEDYAMDELDRLRLLLDTTVDCNFVCRSTILSMY